MRCDILKYKLLVTDDFDSNVIDALKKAKFDIAFFKDKDALVEQVLFQHPDLILLAIKSTSDIDNIKLLKEDTYTRFIPVVFSADSNEYIKEGFHSGGYDYISKPIDIEELTFRIIRQICISKEKQACLKKVKDLEDVIVSRDKMYSVIAHDLRSPISSLKMVLNLLAVKLQKESIDNDIFEMANVANEIAEESFSLLDNLLKWIRIQSGKLKAIPQEIDLVSLSEDAIDVYRSIASLKNITINFTTIPTANIYADIDMIKTCIRNLIGNAVKFSYHDSVIDISIKESSSQFVFSVQDFGCGIKEEYKMNILQQDALGFSTKGTDKEEGSGLGLFLIKDFIRKNNGQFEFESKENVGSIFSLLIPKLHIQSH